MFVLCLYVEEREREREREEREERREREYVQAKYANNAFFSNWDILVFMDMVERVSSSTLTSVLVSLSLAGLRRTCMHKGCVFVKALVQDWWCWW